MEAEMSVQIIKFVFFVGMGLIVLRMMMKFARKVFGSKVVLFIGGYFLGKLFVKLFGKKIYGFANFTEDAIRSRLTKEVNDFGRKK